MKNLALKIGKNLEKLTNKYAQELSNIPNYRELTSEARHDIAQDDLQLIATCLKAKDDTKFVNFTQEKAQERLRERFAPLPLLQALTAIENTLSPLVTNAEAAKFLWHMLSKAQNVVARQIAEQSYYHQREFLWRVIDTAPSFIFVRDREGKFILANQALANAYDASVKNLIGKTDFDFNPNAAEVDQLHRDDLEVMDSLKDKIIPEQIITDAAGNQRWMQIIKRPLADEDGVARRILGIASDITDRKQLEQELQTMLEQRERQVETSTEIAQEIATATDLEEIYRRVVTLINERFGYYHTQIFRHDPKEATMVVIEGYGTAGQKMVAAKHSLPYGKGVVGTAAATGKPVLASDVTTDPNWVPHPALPNTKSELAVPIKWQNEVLGVLDIQSDQTGALTEEDQVVLLGLAGQIASAIESTRLYRELSQQQYLMNALMANVPDAIFFKDTQGRFIGGSQSLITRFGLDDPSEIIGKTDFDFFTDAHAQSAYANEQEVIKTGEPSIIEEKETWPDRPDSWVLTRKLPLRDEEGTIIGTFGISSDFTQRKQVEEALAQDRNLLRTLINNIPDYIYYKDTESKFILNNSAHLASLGAKTQEDTIGKTDFDFFPEELAAQYFADEQKIIETGIPLLNHEEPVVDQTTGNTVWVSTTKVPLQDAEGNIIGLLGVTRDITESKSTEQEKEETLRELEHLASAMSREGWEKLRSKTGTIGYHFDQINVVPDENWWTPEIRQATNQGKLVAASKEGQTAVAPLSVRGEVIGALGVLDNPANPLSQEDLELVEAASEEIALAMESARLFEDAHLRAEEMATLNELAQTLSTQLMVNEVLEAAYKGASRLLDTSNFYIAFYDPETEIISFPFNIENKQRVHLSPRQKGEGLTEHIIKTQEPLLIRENLEHQMKELGIEIIGQLAFSWLGVPLIAGDRILGIMAVQSYTTPRLYDEHDKNMLEAIANQLAIAVQNALLFEETQTALRESEILYEVAQNLGQMEEEQAMLDFILPKYLDYLKFEQGGILILDANGNTGTLKSLIRAGQPVEAGLKISINGNWPMEKMLETKKPVALTDALHNENIAVRKLAKELGYKSLLLVPIIIRDEIIGALGADAIETIHEFTEREIALIQAIANQLAIAMANIRSLEEAQSALSEAEATQRLYLREEWKKFVPDKIAPFYERTQSGLQPLEDVEKALPPQKTLLEQGEGTETKLVVPLLLRGETIGALGLEKSGNNQKWTEEEIALIETVAEQLAIAVEGARLLEETQNRAALERLTGEITTKLRETLDVDSVLRTAVNEIYEAIDLEHVTVRLTEQATLSKKEAEA